jgi:hypothetical protein
MRVTVGRVGAGRGRIELKVPGLDTLADASYSTAVPGSLSLLGAALSYQTRPSVSIRSSRGPLVLVMSER